MSGELIDISWNEFSFLSPNTLQQLWEENYLTDVTLVTEDDHQLEVHKVILASFSPFFKHIFLRNVHQSMIVYLKGVKFKYLEMVTQFIYKGKLKMNQQDLAFFLSTAKSLKIEGFTELVRSEPHQDCTEEVEEQAEEQVEEQVEEQAEEQVGEQAEGQVGEKEARMDTTPSLFEEKHLYSKNKEEGTFICIYCGFQTFIKNYLIHDYHIKV